MPEINLTVQRRGRYEVVWERESSLDQVVSETWTKGEMKRSLGDIAISLQEMIYFVEEVESCEFWFGAKRTG